MRRSTVMKIYLEENSMDAQGDATACQTATRSKLVFSLLLGFALPILSGSTAGAGSLTAVVPPSSISYEDGGASAGLAVAIRMQELYGPELFPNTAIVIREIHFRPDSTYGIGPFQGTISNIRFRLSTTTRTVATMSQTFGDNMGQDATDVFVGPWSLSTAATGPAAGPKAFDIRLPLQVPFRYDPHLGALLLEYRNYSGLPQRLHTDAATTPSGSVRMIYSDGQPDAQIASSGTIGADVLELVYDLDGTSPPVIVQGPVDQIANEGNPVSFSVGAAGAEPFGYQWTFRGLPIPGATNSALLIQSILASDEGPYSVVVSNRFGTAVSAEAFLYVLPQSASQLIAPSSLASVEGPGASAGFSVRIRLQEVYSNSLFPSYPIVIHELRFRPDVTYAVGAFTGTLDSISFQLSTTTNAPGKLSTTFANNVGLDAQLVHSGRWTFSTAFDGPAAGPKAFDIRLPLQQPFRFDPSKGNLLLDYRNTSTLPKRFHTDAASLAGGPVSMLYNDGQPDAATATASNSGADVIDFVYTIDDTVPPQISLQPVGAALVEGQAISLVATATGAPPLTFQWFQDGVAIDGAVNSTLTLANVSPAQTGMYSMVASNKNGSATSKSVRVLVLPKPDALAVVPADAAGIEGSGTSVVASVPIRQQELYSSTLFPDQPIQITQIRFRPDAVFTTANGPYSYSISNLQFRLSTTSRRPGGLSMTFTENRGADEVVVFDGSWFFSTQFRSSAGQGKDFDIVLQLQTPFTYDPAVGNLLLESVNFGMADRLYAFDAAPHGADMERVYIQDPLSPIASGRDPGASILQLGYSAVAAPPRIVGAIPDQVATVGSNATFTVVAAGTRPLNFQWFKGSDPIVGATFSSITLSNVAFGAAGAYSVQVSNALGVVVSAPAQLVVKPGPVKVGFARGQASSGGELALQVRAQANGNENAIAFSLQYDTDFLAFDSATLSDGLQDATLNINPQDADYGFVGFAVALPTGSTLPQGDDALVTIRFRVSPVVTNTSSQVVFVDLPVVEEVVDALAHPVDAEFISGWADITFHGFEGDVAPRPTGDSRLTLADWVQVGRFIAGLDDPTYPDEFQRIDCAPRSSGGDGRLTVRDWVQAGRFVAGLDPVVVAAGPTTNSVHEGGSPLGPQSLDSARLVISSLTGQPGETVVLPVTLVALGGEAALGFSVGFDPLVLTFVGAETAKDSTGAMLNVNTRSVAGGRVGVALALPSNSTLAAGPRQVAKLKFLVRSVRAGTTPVTFDDSPVVREVVDASAGLMLSTYSGATVTINPGAPEVAFSPSGSGFDVSWPASATGFLLESSPSLTNPVWTPVNGSPVTTGDQVTLHVASGEAQGYFRLRRP